VVEYSGWKRLYGWIIQPYFMRRFTVRHLALFAVLAAMCTGIQLTPRPPNVEFTTLISFLASAVIGMSFGVSLGAFVMFINGFVSPSGFAGLILPFQMVGMALAGVAGGLYRRSRNGSYDAQSCFETAVLGAFLTLVYDALTNFAYAMPSMLNGQPVLPTYVAALVSGALFSLTHVVSNTVIFGAGFVPVTKAMQKLFGGEQVWKKESLLT
jgi:hypothetical protein